jgi:uncharacterized RDD family membrane protein YckC
MKIKLLFLFISAFIIDASIVFALSLLLNFLLIQYLYLEILKVFLLLLFVYSTVSYTWKGQTPAKYLLGLKLQTNNGHKPPFIEILKRELASKYILGLIFPFLILYILGYDDFYFNMSLIITCFIVITLLFWLFTKRIWWDIIAKTKFERTDTVKRNILYAYLILLLFWSCLFFLIRCVNNQKQNSDLHVMGFNNPEKYEYPNNAQVDEYVNFLSKPHLSPKDYVFELFKKNDIVILCERFHPEITQWDFIYDIVSDKRFIDSVGNVFTEYGNQDKQSMVDTFLSTKFINDTLLGKSAANLMHYVVTVHPFWNNSNFFYFLKKLNLLNNTLSDSLKIREYYTNQTSWDFVNNKKQYDSITNMNYDSVMAANVINRYRYIKKHEKRKKCLVITNYRHAFNIKHSHNEATYIYKVLPKTTANILINTVAMKYPIEIFWLPIQNGSWDKAFSLIGNKPLGFDFKGSPFGDVEFELNQHFPLGRKYKYQYHDVFTGFIFYNPIEAFREQNSYPYIMDGFEKELARRYKIEHGDTNYVKALIDNYKYLGRYPLKKKLFYLSFPNCVELIFLILLMGFAFIICTYHILVFGFKKKKK